MCDINNPEEGKVLSSALYHSCLINGSKGNDPYINYFYFKYNGTKEEFEEAEKILNKFLDDKVSLVNKLIDKIEESDGKIKSSKGHLIFENSIIPIGVIKN